MNTVRIDAGFFRQRLADELRAFTSEAVDALVAALVNVDGSEYGGLLRRGSERGDPSAGVAGEEDDTGGGHKQRRPDR